LEPEKPFRVNVMKVDPACLFVFQVSSVAYFGSVTL
jgi:hypothetical protein